MESGAVVMDDDTRRTLIQNWQELKCEEIMHPYLKEKVPVGCFHTYRRCCLRGICGEISMHIRHILNGKDKPYAVWKEGELC